MAIATHTAPAYGLVHTGRLQVIGHSRRLAGRTVRSWFRQPWIEVTNVFIPHFFLAVGIAGFGFLADRGFGVSNYLGFLVPMAVLQIVAGPSSASGFAIVSDLQRGYFDKLLLTPASRWSIIFGRVAADGLRAVLYSSIVVAVALTFGSGVVAGVGGVLVLLLMAGLFGVAYSGVGIFIALRTASAEAAQASFMLFYPLLFMAPAYVPREIFSDWLRWIATVNPVTYMMEGMREIVLGDFAASAAVEDVGGSAAAIAEAAGNGWDPERVILAFVAIVGFGALTLSASAFALKRRAG
ncbi:MAG: ABC transporter permease [Chloroflexi bacterium]|nr:ABC transporter permease [Chloroflexota bacterium]